MPPPTTETWLTAPKRAAAEAGNACLVHIYPTGPAMGSRYSLGEKHTVLGRGEDCEIQLQDHSVSRRHAEIQHSAAGFTVSDLQSTNGTFVNDRTVTSAILHDGDYLRVGNNIYRYLAGGNVEAEYHEEIYRLTIVDGLTQIHNQRYLLDFLDRELARSNRHQRPLALILFDIDHFKTINDDLGHLGGDFALRELAGCVRKTTVRRARTCSHDTAARSSAVLVETNLPAAIEVAERVRKTVEAHGFKFEDRPFSLTVSLGVAFTTGEPNLTATALLRQADEKMYEAKRAGRNRVVS